ncbi:MAG TPA: hypothetical protein VGM39_25410 [Kofleriaceae bacterium]|jgi:hypothetical protein
MRACGLLLCGLLAGCSFGANGTYACHDDSNCTGGPGAGRCETDLGVCSFADSSCGDGYRFGDNSGSHSGQCVGGSSDIDASVGSDAPGDGPTIDAPPDAQLCFGTSQQICFTTLPTAPKDLPASIDTGVDGNCDLIVPQTGGLALCVVAGTQVTVPGTRVFGTRPLVVVATGGTITVTGTLDASSRHDGPNKTGPGANAATCSSTNINGENDAGGGAGGGGGGFGGVGGTAGKADTNTSAGNDGDSNGGTGGAVSSNTFIRGGCRGGNGGNGGGTGGAGGDGGGAVYLIANTNITVNGAVYASGAGGTGGPRDGNGGGGGGSGGLIGLDAQAIVINGTLAANGAGGGGGGGTTNANGDAANGGDGTTTNWNQRAVPGPGGTQSPAQNTPGGQGTATTFVDGEPAPSSIGGGGGGGGGIGVIQTHGTLSGGAQVSPTASPI